MTDYDPSSEIKEVLKSGLEIDEPEVIEDEEILSEEVESELPTQSSSISLWAIFVGALGLLAALIGLIFLQEMINPQKKQPTQPLAQAPEGPKVLKVLSSSQDLPEVDPESWELVLVGPKKPAEAMNPELSEVSGFMVDSRIAEATANFLAAAQSIAPSAHIVAAYRSFEEQSASYETFLAQEMEARQIGREAAEAYVQAYYQAPGTSEHMTGLAIDLSTVDTVNLMDPNVTSQLMTIAPDYGFVLRYKESYQPQTDHPAEDWHFRYVGVESARYMTDYDMPLETYLIQLKHRPNKQ